MDEKAEIKSALKTSGAIKCSLFVLSLYSLILTVLLLVACIHFSNELGYMRQQLQANQPLDDTTTYPEEDSNKHPQPDISDDGVSDTRVLHYFDYDTFQSLYRYFADTVRWSSDDDDTIRVINKREVLSSSKGSVMEKMVGDTVKKEWEALMSSLPLFGGAVYIRWGKRSCPASAKIVYRGVAAGTHYSSPGGGSNYQCLAEDPEYGAQFAQGIQSYIGGVKYKYYESPGSTQQNLHDSMVPCVACEAHKRQSKIMIPGKRRCPADWTTEYTGYLVTDATIWGDHYRSTFECVDDNPEGVPGKGKVEDAAMFFHVSAQCSGKGGLNYCPPYQEKRELSCVVCTK